MYRGLSHLLTCSCAVEVVSWAEVGTQHGDLVDLSEGEQRLDGRLQRGRKWRLWMVKW